MVNDPRMKPVGSSGRAAPPLWLWVHDDLARRLDSGEYAAGFPGEHALREQYGVSRDTVRKALRSLRESGVITAQRGRPPRVATNTIEQPLGALYSLFASVELAGLTQRSVVRVLDVRADGVVAVRLGLEESTPLVYLERMRFADDEPLAIDRVWLPAAIAQPLLEADFTHTALYAELARTCSVRITGGQEQIQAVVMTKAEASQLCSPTTSAAFAIDRTGCLSGQPIEWRHTLIRADRFRLCATFSPTTGYQLQTTNLDVQGTASTAGKDNHEPV